MFGNKKLSKNFKKSLAYTETRELIPTFILLNGIVLIIIGTISAFVFIGDWKLFSGLILGNFLSLLNFYLLITISEDILKRKTNKQARFYANLSYGSRYIGLFVICAFFLVLEIVNIATLLIPLFYTKIHYTLNYILFKKY